CAGSRSALTAILPRPISIQLLPLVISPGKRPCTLSYLRRCALLATGPRSLIATISASSHLVSCAARRTIRPVRPKPLMAIRTVMVRPFDSICRSTLNAPQRRYLDLNQSARAFTGDDQAGEETAVTSVPSRKGVTDAELSRVLYQ